MLWVVAKLLSVQETVISCFAKYTTVREIILTKRSHYCYAEYKAMLSSFVRYRSGGQYITTTYLTTKTTKFHLSFAQVQFCLNSLASSMIQFIFNSVRWSWNRSILLTMKINVVQEIRPQEIASYLYLLLYPHIHLNALFQIN